MPTSLIALTPGLLLADCMFSLVRQAGAATTPSPTLGSRVRNETPSIGSAVDIG